jgi:acyl dehydratase
MRWRRQGEKAASPMAFGRAFDEFEVGAVYRHWPGKTVTEYDHHLFCMLTMARHPLHLDAEYAKVATRYQQPLVIGSYVFSLLLGLSEADVAGMAITHKGFEQIEHLAPVMHGDTLYAESEVLAKSPVSGRTERGLVEVETRGKNQHGALIMRFRRKLVVPATRADAIACRVAAGADEASGEANGQVRARPTA